jgi:hypothetical protein
MAEAAEPLRRSQSNICSILVLAWWRVDVLSAVLEGRSVMAARLPRLRHVTPSGPVTPAASPIPVDAVITWYDGRHAPVEALAVAWTREQVEVEWTTPWGDLRRDWVNAYDVHRRSDENVGGSDGSPS